MKTRMFFSVVLVTLLLTGLVTPVAGQGGGVVDAVPQGPTVEEQFKLGLIDEKEFDRLAPQGPGCSPEAAWPGPDGYGYLGSTVDFNWVDITTTGTLISGLTDDGYLTGFPLGFTFNFYGSNYTTFDVANNGFVGFGLTSGSLTNQCPLPSSSTPNNVISLLWDDLYPNYDSGGAYYQTFATCPIGEPIACTVVEYYNWNHYGGAAGSAGTWEAVLWENHVIALQFLDAGVELGSSSTTGIENNDAAADWGLTYACNLANSISSGLAIQFQAPPVPNLNQSYKLAPAAVEIGTNIEYTAGIVNTGTGPADAASMVDPIPAGVTYVDGSLSCSDGTCYYSDVDNTVYWDGQVAANGEVTVQFAVDTFGSACQTEVINVATIVDAALPEPVVVEATTQVWLAIWLYETFEEDFFPPTGWTEAHDPAGMAWTNEDLEPRGNLTGGSGKFAIVDDDYGGSAALTVAELWTAPFDIPVGFSTFFVYKTDYYAISTDESADVDISFDGGATWINLQHWNTSHRGPLTLAIDLTDFAGSTGALVRFFYDDGGHYAWWWEVDDVEIVSCEPPLYPDIEVGPDALDAELCPDEQVVQELTICNIGDAPLEWILSEALPGQIGVAPAGGSAERELSVRAGRPVYLAADPAPQGAGVAAPWIPDAPIPLVLDDGSAENYLGVNDGINGIQFLWANRFTPAPLDFPFDLLEISVVFGSTGVVVGDPVQLLVYEDTDGDGDPSNATLVAAFDETVQVTGGSSFSNYTLAPAVRLDGPGDVLIGVINRYQPGVGLDYPAAIDTSPSQLRSWAGWWNTDIAPDPPLLPPDAAWDLIDNLGFAGNWMVRGAGETVPQDIPWLSEEPTSGTLDPGFCQVVNVTFDSTGLAPDTYSGLLRIGSNDPDEPLVEVPVTLIVNPCEDYVFATHVRIIKVPSRPLLLGIVRAATGDGLTPVPGATVDVTWTLPPGPVIPQTRITNGNGLAFPVMIHLWHGTYVLDLVNIAAAGYIYDPDMNHESSASFTIP